MSSQRYNDYYLVVDEDMPLEESIQYKPRKNCGLKKFLCIFSVVIVALACVAFILVFIGFPLAFKYSVSLQQDLVFTRWGLETNQTVFSHFRFPEYKNYFVPVKDLDNKTTLKLGLWHMLPLELAEDAIYEDSYDFDDALKNSNYSVLLYFHGTGEDRIQSIRKYQVLRIFFHVIAFDYRSYGDSDKGDMFEGNVVNDCLQVYKWLQKKTKAPIYVWGHSLGTSLATSTLAKLGEKANVSGLVLEAPFTSFKDELYNHPMTKFFKWLPWFEATVVTPLEENGFYFNTSQNILGVPSPILFLHAKDDEIIPYSMSEQLYDISKERKVNERVKEITTLVLFDGKLGLNHDFIYGDSYFEFYIYDFLKRCSNHSEIQFYKGSHQS